MLLALALSPLVLWYLYAVAMALASARARYTGTFPWPIRALGYPALFAWLAIDLVVNVVFCTVILLALPREWTVRARLWDYSNRPPSWRQRTALWLRVNLLDPIDPSGIHKG